MKVAVVLLLVIVSIPVAFAQTHNSLERKELSDRAFLDGISDRGVAEKVRGMLGAVETVLFEDNEVSKTREQLKRLGEQGGLVKYIPARHSLVLRVTTELYGIVNVESRGEELYIGTKEMAVRFRKGKPESIFVTIDDKNRHSVAWNAKGEIIEDKAMEVNLPPEIPIKYEDLPTTPTWFKYPATLTFASEMTPELTKQAQELFELGRQFAEYTESHKAEAEYKLLSRTHYGKYDGWDNIHSIHTVITLPYVRRIGVKLKDNSSFTVIYDDKAFGHKRTVITVEDREENVLQRDIRFDADGRLIGMETPPE